jgi:hypothetical protein
VYVLVLVLCVVSDPSLCHAERLPFVQQLSYFDCVFGAQIVAAEYLSSHPESVLGGWSCELPKT